MTNQEIANFNQQILNNNSEITIIEYVKKINDQFFKIDISFIDDFMNLILKKDDFCIHHDILEKYGVISLSSGSTDVLRMLNQNNFTEDNGAFRKVAEANNKTSKVSYYLKPQTFKFLLMRSLKTQKYADYYLLLETAISYYSDFQILPMEKIQSSTCVKQYKEICI